MKELKDLLKHFPQGIDLATVQEMAKSLQNDPELRKAYDKSVNEEGFHEGIEKLSDQVKDLFNHKDSK